MPSFTQPNRPVRIKTPLGEDVLLVKSLTGTERLGRPFQYELVLASEGHELDYKKIIGQNVTVFVDKGDKEARYFNGFVSRFSQTKYEESLAEYRATLVPWLWFLTRTSDCRIFQNLTIPDILKQVFEDHGFSDLITRLHGSYRKWDYCVQYRETAYDFVSRLMEEEGIYYYFKHEADKHSIVLCDSPASHKVFAGYEDILYRPPAKSVLETLNTWVVQHEVQSGAYATTDFDFTAPRKNSLANSSMDRDHGQSRLEQFDYLGEQSPFTEGERYSKLRLEEQQARHETYSGEGDARGICTGVRFMLKGHPRKEFEKEYLTTGAEYQIQANALGSTSEPGAGFKYYAKMTATLLEEQFRAPRVTPKPIVHGPQTAVVVGPSGEKIYTDEYGRVKVHFHWDRHGTADENSSCWVRVSQGWAGKNWGAMFIPHIGQEVIVECLEGDPDRPIITGRVYNAGQMPPMELPANKTKGMLRDDYGNQIIFDGTDGDEHISIYSPHHRSTLDVGRSVKIKTESQKHTLTLGNTYNATIGQNFTVNCGTAATAYGGLCANAVVGVSLNMLLGGGFDLYAGMRASMEFGGKYEYTNGFKYTNTNGAEFSASDDTFHRRSSEDVILDADQTMALIGGDSDHSIAKMSAEGIMLSVGVGGAKAAVKAARDQKNRMLKALVFGVLMAGGAAGAAMTATAIAAKNEESGATPDSTDSDAQKLPDVSEPGMIAGAGILGGVCLIGAIGMTVLGRRINASDKVDAANRVHTDVHSKIELKDDQLLIEAGKSKITITKDGQILIENDDGAGAIKLFSKEKIILNSKAEVQIVGTKVEASKGIFKTKNIEDLG
jgi:type VI secretion system secreted protein VgrG